MNFHSSLLAIAKYGESKIEVYHSYFQPLEQTLPNRLENECYVKLICDKTDDERVIGIHLLCPNSGEILQGFAVAMKYVLIFVHHLAPLTPLKVWCKEVGFRQDHWNTPHYRRRTSFTQSHKELRRERHEDRLLRLIPVAFAIYLQLVTGVTIIL